MEKDSVYVRHILDAIDSIKEFLKDKNYPTFIEDKLLQDEIVRELEVIGEAAKKLSEEFKTGHPDVPWKQIAGTRDKLIHDYFDVDLEVVWKTATEDLKPLKQALEP